MLRRNDIVMMKTDNDSYYPFYGRIVRIIGDKALWICSGLHIHLTPSSKLEKMNYKGKMEWTITPGKVNYYDRDEDGFLIFEKIKFSRPPRFVRMTTLRKLKQRASRYHGRNIWKTPLNYEFMSD